MTANSLLSWAVDFVKREVDMIEDCATDAEGHFDDPQDAELVADARRWLAEAERELAVISKSASAEIGEQS